MNRKVTNRKRDREEKREIESGPECKGRARLRLGDRQRRSV